MGILSRPPFRSMVLDATEKFINNDWMAWFNEVQSNSTMGRVSIYKKAVGSDSSIDFVSIISDEYPKYIIELNNVSIATDDQIVILRVSEDNGENWESGASDYDWIIQSNRISDMNNTGDASDSEIELMIEGMTNTSADGRLCGEIEIYNTYSTDYKTTIKWSLAYQEAGGELCVLTGSGRYLSSNAVNALTLIPASGNFAAGNVTIYGVK